MIIIKIIIIIIIIVMMMIIMTIIINRLGSAMPVYAIHRSDLTMGFNINSA